MYAAAARCDEGVTGQGHLRGPTPIPNPLKRKRYLWVLMSPRAPTTQAKRSQGMERFFHPLYAGSHTSRRCRQWKPSMRIQLRTTRKRSAGRDLGKVDVEPDEVGFFQKATRQLFSVFSAHDSDAKNDNPCREASIQIYKPASIRSTPA